MRIFTANKPRASDSKSNPNGFTLIELLMVIFVIALASAAVLVSLPRSASKLRDDADRMAARIAAARDDAVLESRPIAFWVRPSGYGFEQRRGGQWQPAQGKSFVQVNWTNGTQMVSINGNGEGQARLIFDPTGLPSAPLNLKLSNADAALSITISAAGDVRVAK
jgi:general secretion pathway protein H